MNIFRRFLPYLLPILLVIGFLLLLNNRDQVITLSSVLSACMVFGIILFGWFHDIPLVKKIVYTAIPLLFVLSGITFFLFLEHPVTQYVTLFVIPIMLWFCLEYTFLFVGRGDVSHKSAQKNVSMYLLLCTVFFGTVSLFDLRFFYSLSLAWLTIIGGFFIAFVFWLLFENRSSDFRWKAVTVFSAGLISAELCIALAYWPHTPLVKAIVTTAFIYGMMQVCVDATASLLTPKRLFRISLIICVALLATLITAQWI